MPPEKKYVFSKQMKYTTSLVQVPTIRNSVYVVNLRYVGICRLSRPVYNACVPNKLIICFSNK